MFKFTLLLSCILGAAVCFKIAQYEAEKGCEIQVKENPPIVVDGKTFQYIYPAKKNGPIKVERHISIFCPGSSFIVRQNKYEKIDAYCIQDIVFVIEGKIVKLDNIECSEKRLETVRDADFNCQPGFTAIEIGFNLTGTRFVRQIAICFDENKHSTVHSQHFITSSIGNSQKTDENGVYFRKGTFWKVKYDAYNKSIQQNTINTLLGLDENDTRYVDLKKKNLQRGHLAAQADFVYNFQQYATFYYINTAPQWGHFNDGAWRVVENNIRKFAETEQLDLEVISSTSGILTLPDKEGKEVEIYLDIRNKENKRIPVPKFFWKIVYSASRKQGIVLGGINNPYVVNFDKNSLCNDISATIPWMDKREELFACTYADFKKTVKNAPKLVITSLLI